jgi:hypothetical protein
MSSNKSKVHSCLPRHSQKHIPLPFNQRLNMKVAILGATGQNGTSILGGLLASTEPKFVSLGQIL